MAFFSIIIPAYNAGEYLEETLESVLAQTFTDWEMILVNDGSTDHTPDIAQLFARHHPERRVTIINTENRGLGAARNLAAQKSSGGWLAFLDADDMWTPNKLEQSHQLIANDHEVDWFYHGVWMIKEGGAMRPKKTFAIEKLEDLLLKGNPISPSATLFRRRFFLEYGMFEENRQMVEDLGLWIRLISGGHLPKYLNQKLTYYREGVGVSSHVDSHYEKVKNVLENSCADNLLSAKTCDKAKQRLCYDVGRYLHKTRSFEQAILFYNQSKDTSLKCRGLKMLAAMGVVA